MPADTSAAPPLQGVKVIELSHLIAGPYCGQLLAEEGACVIKVEPPDGELTRHREPMRHAGGRSISGYFGALNRGKKSVALDLKNPGGIALLHRLLESADVVLVSDVRSVGIGTVRSPFELSPLEQAPSTSAATTMNEKAGWDRFMTTPLGDAQVRSRWSAGGDRSRSRSQRPHPIRVGETECERCQDGC